MSMPDMIWANNFGVSRPTHSTKKDRSGVTICEAFATESCALAVLRFILERYIV